MQPFFLNSAGGQIFSYNFPSGSSSQCSDQAVLILPPFAEEMNKSRRMLNLISQSLNSLGYAVFSLDYFGTGDSEGDFAEAKLDLWLQNIKDAYNWLIEAGAKVVHLFTLRFSSLLVSPLHSVMDLQFGKVVICQPILDGNMMMGQFLRLRTAANMLSGKQKETISDLKALLKNNESVEIAGYELNPDLYHAISELRLESLSRNAANEMFWINVASDINKTQSPVVKKMVEKLRMQSINLSECDVLGAPFWTSVEITDAPELLNTVKSIFSEK